MTKGTYVRTPEHRDKMRTISSGPREWKTKHGMKGTPEYRAWDAMWERCRNPRNARYTSYGGRGITVCEDWRSFEGFFASMGLRPSPNHSLDRINNDGNYTPQNCRWATRSEQQRNKRPRVLGRDA